MKAWHFTGETLRDGKPLPPDGQTLRHGGDLVMCKQGLHASVRILDALRYAPGHTICRVVVRGAERQGHDDKIVARERTILCWPVSWGNGSGAVSESRGAAGMSVLACDNCGELIDTDDEPEAYIEKTDKWLCWWCREEIEEDDGHRAQAGQ